MHGGVGVGGVANAGQSSYLPRPWACSVDKMPTGKDHVPSVLLGHLRTVNGCKLGIRTEDTCACMWSTVCACAYTHWEGGDG